MKNYYKQYQTTKNKTTKKTSYKTTKHKKTNPKKTRGGKWSQTYKKSIDCKSPKGFSQRQYCKYSRKSKK